MKKKQEKPAKEKRTLSRCLYTTDNEDQLIKKAAKLCNRSINGYIVDCLITQSRKITEAEKKL